MWSRNITTLSNPCAHFSSTNKVIFVFVFELCLSYSGVSLSSARLEPSRLLPSHPSLLLPPQGGCRARLPCTCHSPPDKAGAEEPLEIWKVHLNLRIPE